MKKIIKLIIILIIILSIQLQASATITDYQTFFRLDENTGTVANDEANNNDGTITATTSWVTGKYGVSALDFDLTDDKVQLDTNNINFNGSFTISAWIKPVTSQYAYSSIVHKDNWNVYLGLQSGRTVQVYVNNANQFATTTTIPADVWTYVTWTHSSSAPDEDKIYINGSLDTIGNLPDVTYLNNNINIGSSYSGLNYFTGSIDEVRFYERVLTNDEINSSMTNSSEATYLSNITSWGNNQTNNESLNISIEIGNYTNFNATANQTITTWNWYKDGSNVNNNFDNYTARWTTNGSKTLTVNATNANGTSNSITWNITITGNNYSVPNITSWENNYTNDQNISFTVPSGTNITFNYTSDQSQTECTITGGITQIACNIDGTWSGYKIFTSSGVVTAYSTNANGTSNTITWTITVPSTALNITSWGNNKTNNQSTMFLVSDLDIINFNVTTTGETGFTWEVNKVEIANNYNNYTYTIPICDETLNSCIWEIRVNVSDATSSVYKEWVVSSRVTAPTVFDYFTDGIITGRTQSDPWGRPLINWANYYGSTSNYGSTNYYLNSTAGDFEGRDIYTANTVVYGTWKFKAYFPSLWEHGIEDGWTTGIKKDDTDRNNFLYYAVTPDTHRRFSWRDTPNTFFTNPDKDNGGYGYTNTVGWHNYTVILQEDGWMYTFSDDILADVYYIKNENITASYYDDPTYRIVHTPIGNDLGFTISHRIGMRNFFDNLEIYENEYLFPNTTIFYGDVIDYYYSTELPHTISSIIIRKSNATLSDINTSINDATKFIYYPENRTAFSYVNISIGDSYSIASLNLNNETLLLNPTADGNIIFAVNYGSNLTMNSSTIDSNNNFYWKWRITNPGDMTGYPLTMISYEPDHEPVPNNNAHTFLGVIDINNSVINNSAHFFIASPSKIKIQNSHITNLHGDNYGVWTGFSDGHNQQSWKTPWNFNKTFALETDFITPMEYVLRNITFSISDDSVDTDIIITQNDETLNKFNAYDLNFTNAVLRTLKPVKFAFIGNPTFYFNGKTPIVNPNISTINISTASSTYVPKYYLDVQVKWSNGTVIQGAVINVTNEINNSYPVENITVLQYHWGDFYSTHSPNYCWCSGKNIHFPNMLVAYNYNDGKIMYSEEELMPTWNITTITGADGHTALPDVNPAQSLIIPDYAQNNTGFQNFTWNITAIFNGTSVSLTGVNPNATWYRTDRNVPTDTQIITFDSGEPAGCGSTDITMLYVDDSGDDTANGTLACPYKTIAKANQTVATGGTVWIIDGTYNDTIVQTNSSVAYRKYNGTVTMDKVSVSGSTAAFNIGTKDSITIDGLTIKNYYYGILVGSGSDSNIFSNNTIWSGDGITDAGYGIVFDNSAATVSNTVINNSVFWLNKTVAGVKIYGNMKNVSIYNNTFNDTAGTTGTTIQNRGIMLDSGADNQFIYNNNMTTQGVRIFIDTSDGNTIYNNNYGIGSTQNCVEIFYDSKNNDIDNETCGVTGGSGYVLWSIGAAAPNNTNINNVIVTTNHNFGIAIRGGNYTSINNSIINMTGITGTVNSGIGVGYDGYNVHDTIIKNTAVNIVSAATGRAIMFGESSDSARNSMINVTLTGGDYDIYVENSINDAAIDSFFNSIKMNQSTARFFVINNSNHPFNNSLGISAYHYSSNSSLVLNNITSSMTFTIFPNLTILATNSSILVNTDNNFTVTNNEGNVSTVNYSNVTNGWTYYLNKDNLETITSTIASDDKVAFTGLTIADGIYEIENQSIEAPECSATISVSNEIIYVYGSNTWADLTCIDSTLNNASQIINNETKEWILKLPIIVNGTTTTFHINSSDANRVKLLNESYIRVDGIPEIVGQNISSWDTYTDTYNTSIDSKSYIYLNGITSGNLSNNTFSYLGNKSEISFSKTGVFVYNTNTALTIQNNTFNNNAIGLYVHTSNSKTIKDNVFRNNTFEGLSVYKGDNYTISNNTAYFNGLRGLKIVTADNITLSSNYEIHHNPNSSTASGFGIDLYNVTNSTMSGDHDIYDNFDNIECAYCNNVTIDGVYNIYNADNDNGILFYGTNNSKIINSRNFWNNKNGIVIDSTGTARSAVNSINNTVSGNYNITSINLNIYIDSTDNSTVVNNYDIKNSINYDGISVKYAYNNNISNNIIYGNYYRGIFSYYSQNNTYKNNTIYNTTLRRDYNIVASTNETILDAKTDSFKVIYILSSDGNTDTEIGFTDNKIFSSTPSTTISAYTDKTNITIDTATINLTILNATIIPSDSADVDIITWNITGDYYKKWNSSAPANYTIGDNPISTNRQVKTNGSNWNTYMSNTTGYINFNFTTEGETQFEIENLTNASTIVVPANSWGMFNNWSTYNTTFSQIATNETNDVTYTYYNSTSGEWESYFIGYTSEASNPIGKHNSVLGFFNAERTVTAATVTPSDTVLPAGWNMLYLEGTSNRTLSEIKTNIELSCTVSDLYYFNMTTQDYDNALTSSLVPNEGFLVDVNPGCTWVRTTI